MFPDFIDLLLPRHCSGCSTMLVKGEPEICTRCRSRIAVSRSFKNSADNELMDRLKGRVPLTHALYYTWFRKSGVIQNLLHSLKYADRPETGVLLGSWFGYEMRKQLIHLEFDYLVPVPMHPSKLLQRGYNQSVCIAEGISSVTEIPVKEMLKRELKGTTQTALGRWQRWQNSEQVYNSFENTIDTGCRVLLIDDVMTTGATAEACIQVLLKGGAASAGMAALALAL